MARPSARRTLIAAVLGGLAPDVSLFVLGGVSLFLLNIPPQVVFGELYFSDAWQTVFAIDNSVFVWGAILGIALWRRSAVGIAFAGAALLHLALDFPLHHDDGRAHFWPLTRWIFESPFSYWDSGQGAAIIAPLEGLIAAGALAVNWRNYALWRVRIAFSVVLVLEFWVIRQWLVFF